MSASQTELTRVTLLSQLRDRPFLAVAPKGNSLSFLPSIYAPPRLGLNEVLKYLGARSQAFLSLKTELSVTDILSSCLGMRGAGSTHDTGAIWLSQVAQECGS